MSVRKVAIYARVSTEHEAQISALDNQVQYYDNILEQHSDWVLYDRYIDEGITGTSTKKRKNFMRMMGDAKDGRFDLIITREVSRFARNTVDTLQETRNLKRIGVEVWFTEDNIWTMNDEDGELRLTLMATLAQNESKKTSLRVKAGQKISFENGVLYGNGNILGYDRVGKEMVINPEQAETVRMIYELYLQGYGAKKLQYELEARKRKTATGLTNWSPSNISRILKNPFYCGIIEYRKQYVPDYLEQKKINNHGDVERIRVEGTHEPIISKEMFDAVQNKIQSHCFKRKDGGVKGFCPSENVWVKKLWCQCNHQFNRKVWHTTKSGEKQYSFQCYNQIRTGTKKSRLKKGLSVDGVCEVPMIQDWKLELMAKLIFERIFFDKKAVLQYANELLEASMREVSKKDYGAEIARNESLLIRERNKLDNLIDMRLAEEISRDTYQEKRESIEARIEEIQASIEKYHNMENESDDVVDQKIKALQDAVKIKFDFDTYNIPDSIIDAFVEKIIVCEDKYLWKLNITNNMVTCLASGSRKNPQVSIVDDVIFPNDCGCSTGCNCAKE